MSRLAIPILCLAIVPAGEGSGSGAPGIPFAEPAEVGMSAERLAKIGAAVQECIDKRQLAGAVTIVARRGRVVHFEARGLRDIGEGKPMEKDTIFRIYSMTKAVVSVAAMILVEEGRLELDAPASRYVPALGRMKVGGTEAQKREMTLRDLLRHSAGFPNNVGTDRFLREAGHPSLAESTLEGMMNRLDVVPLRYQPGEGWYYSFATDVVARLVEVASGQTIDAFLAERIFGPLGMTDTAFHCPPGKRHRFAKVYGNDLRPVAAPQPGTSGPFAFDAPPKFLSGGGGLVSTAPDYMRFCLMLSGRGEFGGVRLLDRETVEMMTRDQLPEGVGEITRPPAGRGFGLGFAVRIREIDSEPSSIGEYEWLGGAGTEFWLSPEDELAVITLSQSLPMRALGSTVKPLVYAAIEGRGQAAAITWRQCLEKEEEWYATEEATAIADDVLYFQAEIGGWYKNDNSVHPSGHAATERLSDARRQAHRAALRARQYPCTLDNDATHSEMRFLAMVHAATGGERFREGFLRGVRYLLEAQYPSGGWPQFFPLRPGYSSRITFNDGAMSGAMSVLHGVAEREAPFDLADDELRKRCAAALARGLECILKCQIVVDGRKTAWCQQHHELTLEPARGRVSELPSISGAESVDIVRYLMSIDDPSPEVVDAIESAVRWFEEVAITGIRVVDVEDPGVPGGRDRRVIADPYADPVWARYHEIGTNRPMFIEEGVVRYRLAELSPKHRLGHRWIGGRWPARLLGIEYPAWLAKRGAAD